MGYLFNPKINRCSYVVPIIRLLICLVIYVVGFYVNLVVWELNPHRLIVVLAIMLFLASAGFFVPIMITQSIVEILFTKDNIKAEREKEKGE